MKKYYLILLAIMPLQGSAREGRGAKRKLEDAFGSLSSSPSPDPKRMCYRPPTPFPHHVVAFMKAGDQYLNPESTHSFTFKGPDEEPLPTADPIPETSALLARRTTQNPWNPDYKKPLPRRERPMTRLYKKRTSCTNCTVSCCQGQGWCAKHK